MRIRIAFGAALAVLAATSSAQSLFESKDRRLVTKTLEKEVRLVVATPPYADHRGAWQVRLTPEGSVWLYNYSKAKNRQSDWNAWIDAKINFDRGEAARKAAELNGGKVQEQPADADFQDEASVGGMDDLSGPLADKPAKAKRAPGDPGPMPEDLKEAMGEAPAFAAAVKPQMYKVSFGDEPPVAFVNQAPVPPRYLFFRSAEGVISGGTPVRSMADDDIAKLCEKAGIDEATWRVMRSVSQLEGGFDSINTYDTGYISVGFIQFTTGANGTGSLGKVLLTEKTADPEAFEKDFHRYGIEVTDKGVLDVFDPASDQEVAGKDAVQAVIADKRLSAVFVRAGKKSLAFKAAQLAVAKERYFAGDDKVTLKLGDTTTAVRVGDVVKSEAGLAILMDRKVNTGRTDPLASVLQRVADESKATCAEDLAAYEDQIVAAVRFRRDFLRDEALSQPVASTRALSLGSRGGPYPRGVRSKKSKTN